VTQLSSSKVLSDKCKSRGDLPKLCVVAVLPHIIDGGAAAREGYLATVSGAAKKVTRRSDSPLLL
jgi:protein disulfide-isomerase A6